MAISDKTFYKDGGCSFVFVCKKRSFKILVSPYFDRAPENLFDENLAILMNLPIKNITCSPHTISGVKTWNVGYISTTVQCVQDGISVGEMHRQSLVVMPWLVVQHTRDCQAQVIKKSQELQNRK